MQLSAGRSRFNLSTLPRDDFPVIAEGDLPTRFELPGGDSSSDHRQDAVCDLDRRDPLLSDGHLPSCRGRRAEGGRDRRSPSGACTVAKPDGADGMPDVIVPRKVRGGAAQAADELEGTVEVSMSRPRFAFGLGSAVSPAS
jgi:DNA polymerase-3 subunit beta